MAGSFYVGPNPSDLIFDGLGERFFYGLRRTDDGELFLAKIDQLGSDSLVINKSGDPVKNYPDLYVSTKMQTQALYLMQIQVNKKIAEYQQVGTKQDIHLITTV